MMRIFSKPITTRHIFWLNGLAPIATNIVTPLTTDHQLKKSQIPAEERKLLVLQEMARQLVSAGIHLGSYFGGAWLVGRLGRKSQSKSLLEIAGGTLMSFVGYGFIRPMISTEILARWLYPGVAKKPALTQGTSNPFGQVLPASPQMQQVVQQTNFQNYLSQVKQRTQLQ